MAIDSSQLHRLFVSVHLRVKWYNIFECRLKDNKFVGFWKLYCYMQWRQVKYDYSTVSHHRRRQYHHPQLPPLVHPEALFNPAQL